jgi:tetratricopeptide (TPR) repeat protein
MIKSGENVQAVEVLQSAITQGESDSLIHALLGVALERTNKIDEALSHYSRAIQMDVSNATAHEGVARISENRGDMANAIEEYSLAYRAQPSFDIAIKLASLLARAGRLQAAIQLYRGLLTERPGDLNLRAEMIRLMAENGQGDEALKELEKLLANQPPNTRLLELAGDLAFKDKPEAAVTYYSRAVETDQTNNRARVQWGASLVRTMQFEEALRVLSDAASREPDNYVARANLATSLFKLKQYPLAAREFIWMIQKRPDVAASYYFLAISFDHIGDCPQATRAYQEFINRADQATNKNEVEEANIRLGMLARLAKDGKCKPLAKEKKK